MTSRFAIACCAALASIASAGTINVPADYATIQEALDASVAGDVIEVAPGTYAGSGDAVVTMPSHPVTLRGTGGAAVTTIDGEGARRGVVFGPITFINNVLELTGTNQAGVVSHHPDLNPADAMTIDFWVDRAAGGGSQGRAITKRPGSGGAYTIGVTESGGACSGGVDVFGSCNGVGWGEFPCGWVHLAIVIDGSTGTATSYQDGILQSEEVFGPCQIGQDGSDLRFGNTNGFSETQFYGRLNNIRVWSSALTQEEVLHSMLNEIVPADVASYPTLEGAWDFEDGMADATGGHNGWLEGGAAIVQLETPGQSVIEGFTIVNGYADGGGGDGIGDGGGMLVDGASPIIRDCTFDSNVAADEGGGLYVMDGDPQVIDCTFTGGHAGSKAGGISLVRSWAVLQGIVVSGNSTDFNGGGLHLHQSDASLDWCFIENNDAGNDGGGLLLFESHAVITACEVTGNTCVYDGAGIAFVSGSDAVVSNCTVSGNAITSTGEGAGWGGGLYCYYSSPSFAECTVSGNTSNTVGGGLASHWSSPSFVDSLVCGNSPDQLHNVDGDGWTDDGGNVFAQDCAVLGTITVCNNGCDYTDIQSAVDHAVGDGGTDTILIGSGVYTSSAGAVLTLPATGLTLRGTTFDADGVPTTVIDGQGSRRGIIVQGSVDVPAGAVQWDAASGGNDHWYLVTDTPPGVQDWHARQSEAELLGGTLASITSAAENQFVLDLVQAALPGGDVDAAVLLGGFTETGSTDPMSGWQWATGEAWGYQNFAVNNNAESFLYAVMTWSGQWDDWTETTPSRGYVVEWSRPTVVEGLLIQNGFASQSDGGGVRITSGSPSFVNCHIVNNQATGVSGPSGGHGAGVYCTDASPVFTGCEIRGNTSQRWGGGVAFFDVPEASFENCRIESNSGTNGGGVILSTSSASFVSCDLIGNSASDDGGGLLFNAGGDASFVDCVVQGNSAGDDGGGIDCQGADSASIAGSRICGNSPDQIAGDWADGGSNIVSEDCFGPWQWRVEDGGNGHWYAFEPCLIPWSDARTAAMQAGGHLACMETETEWVWVRDELVEPLSDTLFAVSGWGVCIGGYQDLDSPDYSEPYGGWTWLTGSPFTCGGEFDCNMENYTGNQHKMSLVRNAGYPIQFNDIDEVPDQPYYMIEWSADCNGDGIVDYGQILDGTLLDDDGDGVPDCCQYTECVTAVQWRIEDGGNGNWYLYNWDQTTGTEGVCWSEARARSLATGGDLVAVSTPEESDFLSHALCPIAGAANGNLGWLGLMPDGSGSYLWSNGEPFDWEFWGDGQPSGDGSYAAFGCDLGGSGGSSMSWNDIGGSGGCHTSGPGGLPLAFWITEYFADCNGDGIVDYGQILDGTLLDDDGDGVPNECDPDSEGVCCLDGACVETTYGACADGGGTWFTGFDCSTLSCVAGTYSVCADGCDFTDIQSAIDHAVFGGVIEVGPGTWDVDLVASGASIEFRSTDGYAATWLDGGDSHRIFRADDGAGATIKFVGFTFANGDADVDDGGALYMDGNTLVLEDCRFISNRAQYGGAVACRNGSLTMTDCIVGQAGLGNVVPEDGGGIHFSDSTLLISGTTFDANEASQGGGLMAVRSTVTIGECSFTANLATTPSSNETQAGGAIEFHSCPSMSVTGCEFVDNQARDGGALALQNPFDYSVPDFVIDDCLFDNNQVDGKGGAIYIGSNAGTVDACEFLNNDADIQGSAIFIAYSDECCPASLTYSNSLFCGSGPEPVEAYDDQVDLVDGGGNTIYGDVGDCVADSSIWRGGGDTTFFSDETNWGYGGVPGAGSDVYFNLDEAYQVDFDAIASSRSLDISSGDVTFDLNGWDFGIQDNDEGDDEISFIKINGSGSGFEAGASLTLINSDVSGMSELACDYNLVLGETKNSQGSLRLAGSVDLWIEETMQVGNSGTGLFTMESASSASMTSMDVGYEPESYGEVRLIGPLVRLDILSQLEIKNGRLEMQDGPTVAVKDSGLSLRTNAWLGGSGTIEGDVFNYGGTIELEPDPIRNFGELFEIAGRYKQREGGKLLLHANSSGIAGLSVGWKAYLGGGLVIIAPEEYDPGGSVSTVILSAAEINSDEPQFDVALMPSLADENKYMSLRYGDGLRGGQQVEIIIETLGGDVGFDPLTPPELTGTPGGLAVGDLAGDGSADDIAVAIGGTPGSIQVFLNDGSGVFGAPASIDIPTYGVGNLIARDVDGDGDPDLLATNRTTDELLVIENLGGGAYAATPLAFGTAADPISLGAIDLHPADGVVDYVAVACNGANSVQLFRNTTGAGLRTIGFVLDDEVPGLDDPIDIDPIDENEDKDIKLLVTLGSTNKVVMLGGQVARAGASSIAELLRVDVGSGPASIITGHLNADGYYDVVTTNRGDGTISVLVNDTTDPAEPSFRPAVNLPVGSDPRSITLVDLDADGDLDIALAAGEDVIVLRNDSDEGSDTLLLAPAENLGISGIPLLVDHGLVDVDQQPDIVTINAPTGRSGDSYESISLRKGDEVKVDPCQQADITGAADEPDGQVNVMDLLKVISDWGCTGNCEADITGDGTVSVGDLLEVISWWGECGN